MPDIKDVQQNTLCPALNMPIVTAHPTIMGVQSQHQIVLSINPCIKNACVFYYNEKMQCKILWLLNKAIKETEGS